MRVEKAKHAGACYGVQRALDLAECTIMDGEPATTLGPLIHNPRVVSELAAQGIKAVDAVEDVRTRGVLVRSHGVAPAVKRAAEARGLEVIDATCPHVARAQKAAAELAAQGCLVVVVGEEGHPEVEGLLAYARDAGGRAVVAGGADDVPDDVRDPVGVVVQTTQTREALAAVAGRLRELGCDPQVKDTVCFATRQRQEAAAALARKVDAIVVIGGRNSSNTTRLAEICAAACPRSFHVESAAEIDPVWFDGCATVGVTAGASTPESHIAAVIERLEAL